MAWFDANPSRQIVNEKMSQMMDEIIAAYESAWPQPTRA
jgi:hypothetical protein